MAGFRKRSLIGERPKGVESRHGRLLAVPPRQDWCVHITIISSGNLERLELRLNSGVLATVAASPRRNTDVEAAARQQSCVPSANRVRLLVRQSMCPHYRDEAGVGGPFGEAGQRSFGGQRGAWVRAVGRTAVDQPALRRARANPFLERAICVLRITCGPAFIVSRTTTIRERLRNRQGTTRKRPVWRRQLPRRSLLLRRR